MKSNLVAENYPLISEMYFRAEYHEDLVRQASHISERLKSQEEAIPKGAIYLNGFMHDSRVTSIDWSRGELFIWLNEFSTHCFADAYAKTYAIKIPHNKRIMPLRLRFSGLKRCQIYWVKGSLKMIPISTIKYLHRLNEYLCDELTCIENERISMGILFWSNKEYPKERRYLLLQVESAHLYIEEHQPQAFIDLFGSDHIDMFNSYWNERQKGQYFDYSRALSLFEDSERIHD